MLLQILNIVVFATVAVPAFSLWRRRRDSATGWLATAFGAFLAVVSVALFLPDDSAGTLRGWHEWGTKLIVVVLATYPYCFLRFTLTFKPSEALLRLGTALTGTVVVITLLLPGWPGEEDQPGWFGFYLLLFVTQWVSLLSIVTVRLWRAGRNETAVARRRMRLLSVSSAMFSFLIVAAAATTSSRAPVVQVLMSTMTYVAAASILVGIAPPAWLRSVWRRAEHQRLYALQAHLIRAETRDDVIEEVLDATSVLFGNGAAGYLDESGTLIASAGTPAEVERLKDVLAASSNGDEDSNQGTLLRSTLTSGELMVEVGRNVPFLGIDEARMLQSVGLMMDSAFTRIAASNELAEARDRALEASRLKSEFLANMSHEIRTPMNGVIGMTDLLFTTGLTAQQREYAEVVRMSCSALLGVINDILDFSKIEAGKVVVNPVDFDVRALLSDVRNLVGVAASQKDVDIFVEVATDVPAALRGDEGRIRQILLNLAGNAVKFTDSGSVRIACDVPEEGSVSLKVTDTGIGIAMDEVDRLFESFTQVDASSTRRHDGTGLGLAIVRRLVELMDGTVHVTSAPGAGSVFEVRLPLETGDAAAIVERPAVEVPVILDFASPSVLPDHSSAVASVTKAGKPKTRVLLVEDNVVNQTVAAGILEVMGCAVVIASDGLEAVELAQREVFAVIFMDCQMPNLDGYESTRRIRSLELNSSVPIVAMTANAMESDRAKCLEAGMNDYLAKPVQFHELSDCLRRWTTESGAAR